MTRRSRVHVHGYPLPWVGEKEGRKEGREEDAVLFSVALSNSVVCVV